MGDWCGPVLSFSKEGVVVISGVKKGGSHWGKRNLSPSMLGGVSSHLRLEVRVQKRGGVILSQSVPGGG